MFASFASRLLLAILGVAMLALAACSAAAPASAPTTGQSASTTAGIQVSDPWTRPAGSGANGAVYLTMRNTGSAPDSLIKAESDVAKAVELHKTEMKDGVMSMSPVAAMDVPAGGELTLKPGEFHIMLIGLNKDIKADDTIKVKLQFEKAGPMEVTAKARSQ